MKDAGVMNKINPRGGALFVLLVIVLKILNNIVCAGVCKSLSTCDNWIEY